MNKLLVVPILALILLFIDWYVFQAVRVVSENLSVIPRRIIYYTYWGITTLVLSGLFLYNFGNPDNYSRVFRMFLLTAVFVNYFAKIFGVLFLLIDDVRRLVQWVYYKVVDDSSSLNAISSDSTLERGNQISRSDFLSKTALLAAGAPMAGMVYGIVSGAHDYRIRRKTVYLPNLPASFDGIKIGQISDIHSGSFFNKTAVRGGVDMFMEEKPDVAFFTGDLVNNEADEVKNYIDIFNKIDAPLGVYSTLGNHDYGTYRNWTSDVAQQKNLEKLKEAHKILGWDLLMNEHRMLLQGSDKLAILGVENWGGRGFIKKGRLDLAHKNTDEAAVKLLLSHDPSHWDLQVRPEFGDIDMMFAGHTHGFQFGVELGDFKWSPSEYVYKQWAGLYQEGKQFLYVNRGYGYLGFPGRVGMPPEITMIELKKA
ncbi:metallophosphoesterase [Xanthovirga aplysinae]|uniref:metallophosphoesterase n=1 Tax=Xanthovirga aplysinae TaxID=2529853 RepID=UPI0012BCF584|nr:metallophosphoesterase [Xanthovirga aplysinae]MTI31627.1 metallophosphoesterase [Xanthovirga aplysinae]